MTSPGAIPAPFPTATAVPGGTATTSSGLGDVASIPPAPTNASDWAVILLALLGINPATHPNALGDLAAQINLEKGSNTVGSGNNPLNLGPGLTYPTWEEGAAATVELIRSNGADAPMLAALQADAPIGTYATALGQSNWEGHGPGASQNVSYGLDVASRYNSMTKGGEGGFAQVSSAMGQWVITNAGSNLGQLPGDIGAAGAGAVGTVKKAVDDATAWESGLTTLLGDIDSAAFWKRIGVFALGAGLVTLGLVIFLSTTKPGQQVESVGAVAALA